MTKKFRTALIGAGNIARTHAEALENSKRADVVAIVDPNVEMAEKLAAQYGGVKTFSSIEGLLAGAEFDVAHVLVPPDLHEVCTRPLIESGHHVLVEKPVADTPEGSEALVKLASDHQVILGVNQNFVWHPAFTKLEREMRDGAIGPIRALRCTYVMPLRQLAAGQFSHWMFREPLNLLLEQAVHPLSQVRALAPNLEILSASTTSEMEIAPGIPFYPKCTMNGVAGDTDVELLFQVGTEYPVWRIELIGEDGVLVADMINNTLHRERKGPYLEFWDQWATMAQSAASGLFQSSVNAVKYVGATAGLLKRNDTFFHAMSGSIEAFYEALQAGRTPRASATFGAGLVADCAKIATLAEMKPAVPPVREEREAENVDVTLFGGTGFIGRYVVSRLLDSGKTVRVVARNVATLPAIFDHENVFLMRGNVKRRDDVARAVKGAGAVINLAHGGGGETFEEIRDAMLESARAVAEECLVDSKKLIHVGSIAGLNLGSREDVITHDTPPDPDAESRADYARAKALCDIMLTEMARDKGLDVIIARPGVVVGQGGDPFHSGVGFYNTSRFCLGWNRGNNPLPFVLAGDVADALVAALEKDLEPGTALNLVGDVRPTAREYIAALADHTRRPLRFKPQFVEVLYAIEYGKWLIKRLAGRQVPPPSKYDLMSRGMAAQFDCRFEKQALGWQPVTEHRVFYAEAFGPNKSHEGH